MSYDASLGGGGYAVSDIKPPIQGGTGYPTAGTAGYPNGATPVHAAGSGANSIATATLAAAAGKTTYCTGFEVSGGAATAATVAGVTLAGILGGTASYGYPVQVSGAPGAPMLVTFSPPVPASAVNTAIVLSAAAFGAGNGFSGVAIHGFQL